MKTRHFVMIGILLLFALMMFSLKEFKKTKELTCTYSGDFSGLDSITTIKFQVRDNIIKDMNMIVDMKIPEEYANNKQSLIDYFNSSGKMKATATQDGIRAQTGMNSEYIKAIGMKKESSYSELKSTLELQGYTCK